jgi:hypothetical protein
MGGERYFADLAGKPGVMGCTAIVEGLMGVAQILLA